MILIPHMSKSEKGQPSRVSAQRPATALGPVRPLSAARQLQIETAALILRLAAWACPRIARQDQTSMRCEHRIQDKQYQF